MTISVSESGGASTSSFESSIIFDASDQDAALRTISRMHGSPRSRRAGRLWMLIPLVLMICWLMLSPLKVVAAFLLVFYLGGFTTLAYAWTRASISTRRTVPAMVREQYPLGEEFSIRADPDGFTVTSPQAASHVAWAMISSIRRVDAGVVVRGHSQQPLFIWPGRVLTDDALRTMNKWIALH